MSGTLQMTLLTASEKRVAGTAATFVGACLLVASVAMPGCSDRELGLNTIVTSSSVNPEQARKMIREATNKQWSIKQLGPIEPEFAEILGEQTRGVLPLMGLDDLTPAAADVLATFKGAVLLDGLVRISPAVASRLAEHRSILTLNGLRTIDESVAVELARHDGDVYLNGLQSLDGETAAAFSSHHGFLSFDGLSEVSLDSIRAICRRKSPTSLNGLTKISPVHTKVIATANGPLFLRGVRGLRAAQKTQLGKNPMVFLGPEEHGAALR